MKRDIDIDVAKGLCITLVIVRHMEVFYKLNIIPFTDIAVPLFFFMSGFYIKTETQFLIFLKNNLKRIILPAIIWALLALCYNIPLQYLNKGFCIIEFNWDSPTPANGALWFLFALFYAKIFFYVMSKVKNRIFIIVFSFVLGYIGVNYEMPCNFNDGMMAVPFLVVGNIYYKYLNYIRDNKYMLLLGIISYILLISKKIAFEISPIEVFHYSLGYYIVCVFAVLLSFLPFLKMVHYLKGGLFAKIGLHTMGILCIHLQICHSFAVVIRKIVPYGSDEWIALSLVSLVLIILLSYNITIFFEKKTPFVFGKF